MDGETNGGQEATQGAQDQAQQGQGQQEAQQGQFVSDGFNRPPVWLIKPVANTRKEAKRQSR